MAGHYGAAERAFEDVLASDSSNKYGYDDDGLIAQMEQRPADAETDYRRALAVDPNFVPAMFNLAIIRADAKVGADVVNLYQRVISIDDRQAARPLATSLPGATVLFSLDSSVWRARACDIAGRNLTRAEAREYLPEGDHTKVDM